jgi:hypothetical protein
MSMVTTKLTNGWNVPIEHCHLDIYDFKEASIDIYDFKEAFIDIYKY